MFNKDLEELKNSHRGTITEMKSKNRSSRIAEAEEQISELDDTMVK